MRNAPGSVSLVRKLVLPLCLWAKRFSSAAATFNWIAAAIKLPILLHAIRMVTALGQHCASRTTDAANRMCRKPSMLGVQVERAPHTLTINRWQRLPNTESSSNYSTLLWHSAQPTMSTANIRSSHFAYAIKISVQVCARVRCETLHIHRASVLALSIAIS